MGMFDKILGKGKKTSSIAITSTGKRKVEELSAGGIRFDILSYLEDNGSSTINELADATRANEHKVRETIKRMEHDGWVKESASSENE
jgi:DNA-binding MarR family transcriptional regulator